MTKKSGLTRWYDEEWIDVCQLPKIVKCGRKKTGRNATRKYPYCRPRKKINSKSPTAYTSLSKAELKRRCSRKRKNPYKKVYGSRKRKVSKSRSRRRRVSKSRARKRRVSKSRYRRRRVSKSRSRRRRNSRSRCRYGTKLNGSCKKKPGPKRIR